MAIPEACGVWIEQRVQEEIDNKKDTGASLREIGRVVAAEVEKYFETKVKPGTIAVRAHRMEKGVTNVTEKSKPTEIIEHSTPEIIENRKPQGGGPRKGAGRKPKEKKKRVKAEMVMDEDFKRAFDVFYREVQRVRLENWKTTSREAALRSVELAKDLIEVE